VIERLRILLDRPLDRRAGQGVLVLACAITVGFAALVALTGGAGHPVRQEPGPTVPVVTTPAPPPATDRPRASVGPRPGPAEVRQDPQDRPGSVAARRAGRELAGHRALQHVPWRGDGVSVRLVGARGARAVLAVRAASPRAAERGWHGFLRRYHDAGRAYLPRFEITGGRRG
jgi:hypothetical protein